MRYFTAIFTVFLLAGSAFAQNPNPGEKVKLLEPLVGTWEGSYVGDDGQARECKGVMRWAEGKFALTWTWADWPKGKPESISMRGSGICHWDPIAKKVKEYGVFADGGYMRTYFTAEGANIIGERTLIDPAGKKSISRECWKITGDTWFSAEVEVRDADGKVLKKFPTSTLRRTSP